MISTEVLVNIVFGIIALIISLAGLYLQWRLTNSSRIQDEELALNDVGIGEVQDLDPPSTHRMYQDKAFIDLPRDGINNDSSNISGSDQASKSVAHGQVEIHEATQQSDPLTMHDALPSKKECIEGLSEQFLE